jgi:putative endopeptidase
MKTRRIKKKNNMTKKNVHSNKQLQTLCKTHSNSFNSFEKEYGKMNKPNKPNYNVEKSLVKLFKTSFTPVEYKSKNDYYTYINYEWINKQTQNLKLKKNIKYYVQIDSFRVTQEKVYYELINIVKSYIKNNNSEKATQIKNVYESLLHLDNKSAEEYISYYINLVDTKIASNNFYGLLGDQNRNEIISWGCPIVWSVLKDEKNVKKFSSYISPPQLTIYDYTIYIEDTKEDQNIQKYKTEFKQRYLKYIDELFDVCLGKNNGIKATDIWDCEYDMLIAGSCSSIKKDDENGYNLITKQEALDNYNFDWEHLTKEIGYTKAPNTFICTSTNYLKCITNLLFKDDAWRTPKWRAYWLYITFRQVMRFHSKWRLIYYDFHGKFIKGQPIPVPKEIYPVFGLSFCFNTFLTNEYIDKNKKQQYIDYVHNMATDLLTVYKRIITRNTWLSPSTKKYALLKLDTIKLVVGSPKILREDATLIYDNKKAYQNMKKIAHWRTNKMIELDGKESEIDIPIIDWQELKMVGKQSYIVNAYYTPTENAIYVPLAYLQKPFIDLDERGIEYNLAHIGYTLGHELSHCLDDVGSKYDHNGNLHNWWTKSDRDKFNKKVQNVIKQYETFAAYDGIKMDASLSTGENLADISGVAICMEYLKDFQQINDDIVPIRALSFHAFFIYFAVQARQKILDAAITAQLKTNPHPMDKYRTNCPLARLELFRSLYNVKKGDKMYWSSTDTIW